MGYPLQQSDTGHVIAFCLVSSSDHITGLTGATVTVRISKNGGAFAAPTGTLAEIGNGWYGLTPSAADVGTLGPLLLHASATGADPFDDQYVVVAYNPYSGTIGMTIPTDAGIQSDVQTALTSQGITTTRAAKLDNLDATVSSRLAASAYTPPGTAPTVAQIAAAILKTPANLLATDGSGDVTFNNTVSIPTPPTAAQIRQEIDANSTQLASLVTGQGTINTNISAVPGAVWNNTTRTLTAFAFTPTVGGYAAGQDPWTLLYAQAKFKRLCAFVPKKYSVDESVAGQVTKTAYDEDGTTVLETFTTTFNTSNYHATGGSAS